MTSGEAASLLAVHVDVTGAKKVIVVYIIEMSGV